MPLTQNKGHMTLEILLLTWDRHKNVAGLNQLMGSQPFSSLVGTYHYDVHVFLGQRWIEADVMAGKRKPAESNEIIDDGELSALCNIITEVFVM